MLIEIIALAKCIKLALSNQIFGTFFTLFCLWLQFPIYIHRGISHGQTKIANLKGSCSENAGESQLGIWDILGIEKM